jgi:NodT family efflux transporter outer membrane factor (OMF) lipoprotein
MARSAPFVLGLMLGICACTVGPDYAGPHLPRPPDFTLQAQHAAADQLQAWWRHFNDPVLDDLVAHMLAQNLELQVAGKKLLVAEAQRRIAGAAELPQIDAGANVTLANSSTTLQYPPGNGTYRDYTFGFDASWELDIFGGTRRAEEAADHDLEAAVQQRRGVLVSLLGELAQDYAVLRASQFREGIAQRNIATARQSLEITQSGFVRGLTSNLAVAQAQAELETEQAAVPLLQDQQAKLIDGMAVLLGEYPAALRHTLDQVSPTLPVPPVLPETLPSEVIANRPDIRKSERTLAADTARIGVAIADLYPHFSIPLALTPQTSYLRDSFTAASLMWSIGLTLTQGVYEGGRRTARIDAARATADADLLTYKQTVLTAFREVEDALIDLQMATRRAAFLHRAAADSRLALTRAERLFGAGLADYLQVLTSQRSLVAADDAAAQGDLARIQAVVTLYQSLGGGWQGVSFSNKK